MNIGIAATYAALAFLLFSLPSGRMLDFADRQYQRGLRALPAVGLGIVLARAVFFCVGLVAAMAFVRVMPSGLALARIVASLVIVIAILKGFSGLKRPFPGADNDNLEKPRPFLSIWHGMRIRDGVFRETALAAAMLVLFIGPSTATFETAKTLAAAHVAASLSALLLYAAFARPVLARLNRRKDAARRERIARLLRSGLPRVSARFSKDAA
ncbi:hypothetical protein [Martelella soudanensis]|uniref:hypothetical protein n=1 Tax=unclassified Martelella TaxID=2629616 RepID=UPI0015DFC1AC|nr:MULTISPECIES: hypothetical protein [unclassified Martelella]